MSVPVHSLVEFLVYCLAFCLCNILVMFSGVCLMLFVTSMSVFLNAFITHANHNNIVFIFLLSFCCLRGLAPLKIPLTCIILLGPSAPQGSGVGLVLGKCFLDYSELIFVGLNSA